MAFYKKISCALLSLVMIFTCSACSSSISKTYTYKTSDEKIVSTKNTDKKYNTIDTEKLELICSSGLVELYLDKESYAIVVKETSNGNYWHSLPSDSINDASIVSLYVSKGDKLYKLNSQANSVAFGKAKYEKKKNGVWLSYILSEKKDKPEISIPVTVKFTLEDGSLNVDIDCKEINNNKSITVEKIELLKYFGATNTAQDGDFIVIPDGCGAKINTAVSTDSQNYDLKVYGQDYSAKTENVKSAIVPAFGIKNATGAFGAIIRQGDSLATISATKAKEGEYNTVGTVFEITPTQMTSNSGKTVKTVAKNSYDGNLSLCYRFLSGINATYSGIAAVCREQLTRDAVLSTQPIQKTGTYPINISLIGEAKKNKLQSQTLTSFEQAQEVIGLLKAKGINDLNLCYDGAFTGGTEQSNIKNAKLANSLGSKEKLEELYSYMSAQEFGLFFDVNILSASSGAKAKNIRGNKTVAEIKNPLYNYWGQNATLKNLAKSKKIEDNIVSFISKSKKMQFTGYCINDAGSILYSDFSGGFVNREQMKSLISQQVITMSTNHDTMAKNGNFYMLKNVDYILDIPMNTGYKTTSSYEEIPFVQTILHGTIEYSALPVNLSKDYTKTFLKSVEYGAMLSFEMTFSELLNKDSDEKSNLNYEEWIVKSVDGYKKFNDLFQDLRDAKITNHYMVQEDLYCTVYNNMNYVYVNYSNEDITYNNLVIKANNYLRVN